MAARPPWSRIAPVGNMYRVGLMSSTVTAFTGGAAGTMTSSLFSFQWVSGTRIAQITQVEFQWSVNATITTNQDLPFGLFVVRKFTTAPTGGTAATFTASVTNALSGAFDTNFGTTSFATSGDIRIGSTALLTGGTGNIDTCPQRQWVGGAGVTQFLGAGPVTQMPAWAEYGADPNNQALWLRNQEGFSIQPLASLGSVGSLVFYVTVEWIEAPSNFL